ncbi:hypothetical protein THOM_0974 [Trachipleistophora hominis]|uniref:Uncharacterized protein n=1 Tax=Trachipleistophora hominis TaxID=72359 RepID=L7JXA4_TRAHO|nr:hypothetical protein THOM_0974 [Trachipleistophora hominis]
MGQHEMMAMSGTTYYKYGPPPELYDAEAGERRRKRRRERNRKYRAKKGP